MGLRGQCSASERGYAMAALLVTMAIMAVLMSVALPVWRHEAQREKETELVWRGLQYVRAIRLFQAKTGGLPPNIDVLLQGRFLRKKYKDPITNDDFQVLNAGSPAPGQAGEGAQPGQRSTGGIGQQPVTVGGAVIGVVSKSKAESIREYLGRTHYNEWTFVYVNQGGPGRGGPLSPVPGLPGRGGRGGRGGEGGERGRGAFPGRGVPGRGFPGGRNPGIGPGVRTMPFPGGRGG